MAAAGSLRHRVPGESPRHERRDPGEELWRLYGPLPAHEQAAFTSPPDGRPTGGRGLSGVPQFIDQRDQPPSGLDIYQSCTETAKTPGPHAPGVDWAAKSNLQVKA